MRVLHLEALLHDLKSQKKISWRNSLFKKCACTLRLPRTNRVNKLIIRTCRYALHCDNYFTYVCLFYNKTFITFTFFMINVSQTTFLLIKCRIKIKQLIYLLFQVNCCTHSALSRLFHINFSSTKKVNEMEKF